MRLVFLFGLCFSSIITFAQSSNSLDASDPVTMKSKAVMDAESYFYYGGAQFYALRFGYFYGLNSAKHLVGMSLPFVHTIFNANYGGFENTSGIGDLKLSYLYVPYFKRNTIGLERVSVSLDVSAPTGEYQAGRGAGSWLFKPGVIFTIRSSPVIAFFPEIRFQFSGKEVNSEGGSDGLPDPNDPEKDKKLQNLSVSWPMVIQVKDWNGWLSFNALYAHSFTEKTGFLFLRTDFGKMIGDKTSASLRITKFIAGQPRLNVMVQANFQFFLR